MSKRSLLIFGAVTYTILAAMSLYFYKERTMFTDMAYHLFFILKDCDFAIQNYRFGAFFTQLFPLIGARLGLSLATIAQLYSLSFIVLYATTFFALLQIDRSKNIALSYLLFSVLMVRHTFFWIQSELPQAAAFAFIYFALLYEILQSAKAHFGSKLLLVVLLIVVVFSHPLMLFLLSFILLFLIYKFPRKRQFILSHFLFFLTIYFVKSYFFKTSYDSQAMSKLLHGLKLFPHYLDIPSNVLWLKYFTSDYLLLSALFLASAMFLLVQKRYFLLALMGVYFLGYSFMVNLTEVNGADQYYIENQYLLLSAFAIIPFVFEVLPFFKQRIRAAYWIAPMLACSLLFIFKSHAIFSERLEFLQRFVSNVHKATPVKKLVLSKATLPQKTIFMNWAISYEIWLISTVELNETLSVIEEEQDNEFSGALNATRTFQAKWGLFDYNEFPQKYFVFKDTTTTYVRY